MHWFRHTCVCVRLRCGFALEIRVCVFKKARAGTETGRTAEEMGIIGFSGSSALLSIMMFRTVCAPSLPEICSIAFVKASRGFDQEGK